jgi:L-seryl-tRNA(Ser) seleniumtransferase
MVIYSGGKFLRGPQTSGLLLGRKDLIQAAWRNASPHQAFARGMKVSKEDVIGVLTALEIWFERRDPAAEQRRWNDDLASIAGCLRLPGITATVIAPHGVVRVPRLRVAWDAAGRIDGEALRRKLLDGEPRIMLDDMAVRPNAIEIDPFGLQPGEAVQVGGTIAAHLTAPVPEAAVRSGPGIDVSGTWDLEVVFLRGARGHRITLRQQDDVISGEHRSDQFEGVVAGGIDEAGVHLMLSAWHEGAMIAYHLDGALENGGIAGDVRLGSATASRQGPINMAQFGPGRFRAVRVDSGVGETR